jgi:PAS domain S-box-containing protein
MDGKPTYEVLEQRVKALGMEIAERNQEKEALRKACEEAEYRMESRTAKLIKANRQLKQEIEERAENEQALKDSQRMLQIILDTIEGEVFVKDTNGKYLFVNKAFGKDFGVDPNDVIGKDDYFVFSPEAAAKLQENDKRIMAGRKAENIEEILIWKDGSRKGLLSSLKLLINYARQNCVIAPWPISLTTGNTGQIWTGPYDMFLHPVSAYPAIPPSSLWTTLLYTVRLLFRRISTAGVNITMIPP